MRLPGADLSPFSKKIGEKLKKVLTSKEGCAIINTVAGSEYRSCDDPAR